MSNTKCDVCNEIKHVINCSSSCNGLSFNYCTTCLNSGLEPYSALVNMGLFFADINNSYKKKILIPSLKFFGKSIDDFDSDVERMYKDKENHSKDIIDSSNKKLTK